MHVQQNVAIECLAISTSLVKWLFSSLSLVSFFPFHSVFRPMGSCVFNHCFLWLQQALHCTVAVVAFALFYFFRFYFVHSAHTVAWWLCESVHTGTFKRLTGWLVGCLCCQCIGIFFYSSHTAFYMIRARQTPSHHRQMELNEK